MLNKAKFDWLIVIAVMTAVWFGIAESSQDIEADSIGQIVDSLFIRASSGEIRYQKEVEPARKALIAMGATAVPYLLNKLDTRDAREMLELTEIFKGIGEIAVESLVSVLGSDDNFTRRLAIRCLGEIKSEKAVWSLAPMATHSDFRTRTETMTALGNIGSAKGAPIVQRGLSDTVELVATAAAAACGKIKKDIDPKLLLGAFKHPYYGVRYAAAKSLSLIGEPIISSVAAFIDSTGDVGPRCFAILALGIESSDQSAKILSRYCGDDNWRIRAAVVEALGKTKVNRAKALLKKMLDKEKHPLVISRANVSLADWN